MQFLYVQAGLPFPEYYGDKQPLPHEQNRSSKSQHTTHKEVEVTSWCANQTAACVLWRITNAERQALVAKSKVLSDRRVVALPVRDVEIGKIVRHAEKHVHLLIQAIETISVVGKFVIVVGRGSISQEDALNLTRIIFGYCWVCFL